MIGSKLLFTHPVQAGTCGSRQATKSAALHFGPVKEAPRFEMPATRCCGPVTGGNLGLYSLSNKKGLSEA
jgi:hypothetical protein